MMSKRDSERERERERQTVLLRWPGAGLAKKLPAEGSHGKHHKPLGPGPDRRGMKPKSSCAPSTPSSVKKSAASSRASTRLPDGCCALFLHCV